MAITHQHLLHHLDYDPETGIFYWKVAGCRRGIGKAAGSVQKNGPAKGYVYITVTGEKYRAHRLAWFYTHGWLPKLIDHIDGNPGNNAINNLRIATQQQNMHNAKLSKRNKSGYKGVCWDKNKSKWMASIRLPCGKQSTIGRYNTKEEAAKAFAEVAARTRGDFARKF